MDNFICFTATVTIVDSAADTPATLGGTLTLKFENGQVSITGSVSGFTANSNGAAHGFHIHETGSTANDCKAAGGHFNPDQVGLLSLQYLPSPISSNSVSVKNK